MHRENKRNKIIIFSLIGILLLMAAGYAAFKTNLEIKGNTKITSNWDVEIINISEGEKTGKAKSAKTPSWTKTEANMEANLYGKEDSISYIVTIENKGTLDAKLDNINIGEGTNEDAINVSFSGYIKGQTLKKQSRMDVKVTISYNPNYEGGETSSEINTSFDFVQNEGGNIKPTNDYLVTYNYITNGGTSSNAENEYLPEGSNINLSYTASKEGYEFVGWNTSALAKEGLTELTLTENTTLFAIFKKDIKVTYEKGSNVKSIGKESENCTIYNNDSCTITLPSIEVNDGFAVDGWYDGENNIGTPNGSYQVKDNKLLTAKATQTDYEGPAITFDPSIQSEYTNGTEVSVKLDDIAGIKAGQTISYAWSTSNTESPFTSGLQVQTAELGNNEGDKSVTVTIPRSSSSNLTGTYYLWIKGGLSDILGNQTEDKVSESFNFDNESPVVSISTSSTTKSITVTANTLSLSGISKYEFSINDEQWIQGDSNVYTFNGLDDKAEYTVSVRVTSKIGKTNTARTEARTQSIPLPDFSEADNYDSKTVTITYPEGCGDTYTCSYIKDGEDSVPVNDKTVSLDYSKNGNVIAIVNDGQNEASSVYEVEVLQVMKAWLWDLTSDFHNDEYRGYITSVEVLDNKNVPDNAFASWDVSEKGDGGVMAWVIEDLEAEEAQENAQTDNTDTDNPEEEPEIHKYYKLYIGGDSGVRANKSLTTLFRGFTSLKTADLTKLDTSQTTTMNYMFSGCNNLTSLDISSFDTSNVTDMQNMFDGCNSLTSLDLSNFDTSKVTNMSSMFRNCSGFTTLDINNFDTSNVTNMDYMFAGMSKLTEITYGDNWTTENVTTMQSMFQGCSSFKSIDLSKFDTSKVTTMKWMFEGCSSLTSLDLSYLDTSNVTNMYGTFATLTSLTSLDLSPLNTSKVTNMQEIFMNSSSLTSINLSNFNTSNVVNMQSMFSGCSGLTSLDLSNFDTSNVTNMYGMFAGMSKLTEITYGDNWTTENVTTMQSMFQGCSSFKSIDLSKFDTSKVTTMKWMFEGCSSLTSLDLSYLDTSNVTNMYGTFATLTSLTSLDLSPLNTSKVTNMQEIFMNSSSLTSINLSNFNTSNVVNMQSMFSGCSGLTSLDLSNFDTSNATNMTAMFRGCSAINTLDLNTFNTIKVNSMRLMFQNMSKLTNIIYGTNWTTENVTNMGNMFEGCSSFEDLDLSNFDTSNVTNMGYMFAGMSKLTNIIYGINWTTKNVTDMSYMFASTPFTTLDLSNIITNKVTNMNSMFKNMRKLTEINFGENWTTENVTDMAGMFSECISLETIDLSKFNTNKVTEIGGMFSNCYSLESLDLSKFDTSNAIGMTWMFNGCRSLTSLDLSSFNTNQVTDMSYMFYASPNLTTIYVGPNWTTENVENMTDMFTGCGTQTVTPKL